MKETFSLFLIGLIVLSMFSFLSPKVNAQETVLFSDDFESYAAGTRPSHPWEFWFGKNGEIVGTTYVSPTKSLRLLGSWGWSTEAIRRFTSTAAVIGYEVYGKVEGFGKPYASLTVAFVKWTSQTTSDVVAGVSFWYDGTIIVAGRRPIGAYEPNRWYKIRVLFNRENNTYDVWINDVLMASSVPTDYANPYDIEGFAIMSEWAEINCYFDDAKVFEGELLPTHIYLEDFRYEDLLPSSFEDLIEILGWGNIAVKGRFHATLNPPSSIEKAHIVVVAEYVTIGERGAVKKEIRSFELKPTGNEFIADINLETVWPANIVNWVTAIVAWKILGDPSYFIENIGEDAYLPKYIIYFGFERIYIGAKLTKITGIDKAGRSFELTLDSPLPLKTSYKKLAEWAENEDYGLVISLSPIALSLVDKNGHRVGAYKGEVISKSANMYYVGEAGKPQLIVVETPLVDSLYLIEIEGTDHGNYTLIAGQKIGGTVSSTTLSAEKKIQRNEIQTYDIKFTSTGIKEMVPWQFQNQLWIIAAIIVAIIGVTALLSIATLTRRRKNLRSK